VTAQGERFLAALEAEIEKLSKLEHELARTRRLLQEYTTRLRLGANPQLIMSALRLSVPNETTLALIERVDPVLSTLAKPEPPHANQGLSGDSSVSNSRDTHDAVDRR
jgi:hypothetical protein